MLTFNNKIVLSNDKWIEKPLPPIDPYNPLGLPPNTIRVRTNDGNAPSGGTFDTATLVSGTADVYDVYKSGDSFYALFRQASNLIEVLGANTSEVTDMRAMFQSCSYLQSVALFDTRNVTNMYYMFNYCSRLTSVPLYDTSNVLDMQYMFSGCATLDTIPALDTRNVTNMDHTFANSRITSVPLLNTSKVSNMDYTFATCFYLINIPLFDTSSVTTMNRTFSYCRRVESGALALYQQASSQANPPTVHTNTFYNCGSSTTTGAAELAQIPADWKGE